MVLKKENYIYTTVTTWGWTDETLMTAILGFLPDDKETHMISGNEGRILCCQCQSDHLSVLRMSICEFAS